jgi:hypothetical protein
MGDSSTIDPSQYSGSDLADISDAAYAQVSEVGIINICLQQSGWTVSESLESTYLCICNHLHVVCHC